MGPNMLKKKFETMGARLKISPQRFNRWGRPTVEGTLSLDIGNDRQGEFFDLAVDPDVADGLNVVDVRPKRRHLLLMADDKVTGEGKQKFLCGHDERHWFVAAVPGRPANVSTALEALAATRPFLARSFCR